MRRGIAAAFAAVVLLGAAPEPAVRPAEGHAGSFVPPGTQTALLRRYIDALVAHRYADAYALLDAPGRMYFRTPANFTGTFQADDFSVLSYEIRASTISERLRVRIYSVREHVRLRDPARNVTGTATIDVTYGVTGAGANARIKDLGRPWKSFAVSATARTNAVRVAVHKISFYNKRISVVVTIANLGTGFVTLLPYGRSALRDDRGHVYHPTTIGDVAQASQTFALGAHLAANAQLTGALEFDVPHGDAGARSYALTVAPNVRDGADAPFSVEVAPIVIPA